MPLLLQEVQFDALTDRPLHIDFLRVDMDKPMPVEVELAYLGVPKGQSQGGQLLKDRTTLKVLSLPASIPHDIQVRVAGVDIGDEVKAGSLKLPEGVSLDCSPDTVICRMPA